MVCLTYTYSDRQSKNMTIFNFSNTTLQCKKQFIKFMINSLRYPSFITPWWIPCCNEQTNLNQMQLSTGNH